MNWSELFDTFEVKDNSPSDEQIESLTGELDALVGHKDFLLFLHNNSSRRQFVKHRLLVYIFDESRSQLPMHLNCCPDDFRCQLLVLRRNWIVLHKSIHPFRS